jgi:hypothetical protein
MIYTAPCVMFLMRADPLRGQVGGGLGPGNGEFFGPVKWHRADMRVPFRTPCSPDNDDHHSRENFSGALCNILVRTFLTF